MIKAKDVWWICGDCGQENDVSTAQLDVIGNDYKSDVHCPSCGFTMGSIKEMEEQDYREHEGAKGE
jgi:predicted RNA-binding Zn-ribbon protein involved in translation (DUF1610 family)